MRALPGGPRVPRGRPLVPRSRGRSRHPHRIHYPVNHHGRNPPLTPPRRGTSESGSPPPEGLGVGSGDRCAITRSCDLSPVGRESREAVRLSPARGDARATHTESTTHEPPRLEPTPYPSPEGPGNDARNQVERKNLLRPGVVAARDHPPGATRRCCATAARSPGDDRPRQTFRQKNRRVDTR